MAPNVANEPRFLFGTPDLPNGELEVVDFVGREAISQVFRFELNLVSKNPSVPFSDLVDRRATLTMKSDTEASYVHGIVADFQQGSPIGDYFRYRAVLVPKLWRLALTFQSRVFQHLSVPEIVRKVIEAEGFGPDDFRFALSGSYPPREYCTQYKETDLAFISRLLEYEGIQFFFEQQAEREVLVMTDDRGENPPIGGDDDTVIYRPAGGMAPAHEETVREFIFREQMVTGRVILKDYNYRTPEADLRAESQISGEMPGVYYEYGSHIKDAGAAGRLARVRNEEIECRRRVGSGEGTCSRLRAGHHFTLDAHYRLDLNQPYLVTEITHHGTQRGGVSMQVGGEDRAMPYSNSFACIPAAMPYRPPRVTPEPRLPGIMTARVESGGGDYAYLDDEGRYRIKLPFDLADTEEAQGSKSIRQAQPYTGANGAGFHLPSHPDTEIVFACVDGDLDRPLALGSAPNPDTPSPVTSANPSQFIFRTTSENEFQIEDEHGNERVMLWTPYAKTKLALGHDGKNKGVSLQTEESFTIQGKQGGFLYGGNGMILSTWAGGQDGALQLINQFTPMVGTLMALAATKFSGGGLEFSNFFKAVKSMNTVAGLGLNLASLAGGVIEANPELGAGQDVTSILKSMSQPGIFLTAQGGADIVTQGGTSILAGAGISLFSPLGVTMGSLDDISLITGKAIAGYAREGGIQLVSDEKDVEVEAKQKDIKLGAETNLSVTARKGNVNVVAEQEDVSLKAEKRVSLRSEKAQIIVSSEDDVVVTSRKGSVGVEAENEVVIACGSASITLKKDGTITMKGKDITLDASSNVKVKGMNVTSEAQSNHKVSGLNVVSEAKMKNDVKGTMANLDATGIAGVKGSLVKVG